MSTYINYPGFIPPSITNSPGPLALSPPPVTSVVEEPAIPTPWSPQLQTNNLVQVLPSNPSVLNANGTTIRNGG